MVAKKAETIREGGPGEWIKTLVDLWRQHSAYPGLSIVEDDEKFILTVNPCGSGGRLINMGAYDGALGYKKLKKAGPHTWGETDVPIYCSHCPWVHEIFPIREGGQGAQFWVHASPFPKKPGDPCVHHIYKDPKGHSGEILRTDRIEEAELTPAPSRRIITILR
jgi:hypothetical protein